MCKWVRTEGRREFTLVGTDAEGDTEGHHFMGSPKLPSTGGFGTPIAVQKIAAVARSRKADLDILTGQIGMRKSKGRYQSPGHPAIRKNFSSHRLRLDRYDSRSNRNNYVLDVTVHTAADWRLGDGRLKPEIATR